MKKVFSIFILILALGGIIALTTYTLTHRGLKQRIEPKKNEEIELINTNYSGNTMSEIYSIYLNAERHRIKFEYQLNINEETSSGPLELTIYLDGKRTTHRTLINEAADGNLKEIIPSEDLNIEITKEDFQIVKMDGNEYLLLKTKENNGYLKEYYLLINSVGNLVINDELLIKDESINYVDNEGNPLDFFYNDTDQIMSKYVDGTIYHLEPKPIKNVYQFVEYKYYLTEGQIEKEEINIYDNIMGEEITQ